MIGVVAAVLLQVAPTTGAPVPTARTDADIIVVGRDLKASARALKDCRARKCPPKEDIFLSMAHAENQFVAGDYDDAWVTLTRSRKRNERFAATLPKEVAGLVQFSADVSAVTGYSDVARVGTIDALSALKKGLPKGTAALDEKRLEIGDAFMGQGQWEMALATYDRVAKRARAAGQTGVAGRAMLRGAQLYVSLSHDHAMFGPGARERIATLKATRDPAMRSFRDAARVLEARMASDNGDSGPLDRLLADNRERTKQPMLVLAPRINLNRPATQVFQQADPMFYDVEDQWVDFDFVINADGRVADVSERRRGAHADGRWIQLAQRSLAGRRYLPLDLPVGTTQLPRLERFILVSGKSDTTLSNIVRSTGAPSVMSIDMTATDSPRTMPRS